MPQHTERGTTRTAPRARTRRSAAKLALVGALLAGAASASAHAGPSDHRSLVAGVRTAATFDYAAGEIPENISVGPDGSAVVSLIGSCAVCQRTQPPRLLRIAASGTRTVLATGRIGEAITGNVRGQNGTIYFSVWAPGNVDRNGVYALRPGSAERRIAALPADSGPNGLAINESGSALFIADSFKATIWTVPTAGGVATPWVTDPSLAPVPTQPLPIGANGIKFHGGALWVSNFNQGTLLRIPVTSSREPGSIRQIAQGIPNIDDFSFLSPKVDVALVTQNGSSSQSGPDRVVAVYRDGTIRTLLTAADGLATPSATAVRGDRLYITNGGVPEPHDAKLQVAKLNVGALLATARSHAATR